VQTETSKCGERRNRSDGSVAWGLGVPQRGLNGQGWLTTGISAARRVRPGHSPPPVTGPSNRRVVRSCGSGIAGRGPPCSGPLKASINSLDPRPPHLMKTLRMRLSPTFTETTSALAGEVRQEPSPADDLDSRIKRPPFAIVNPKGFLSDRRQVEFAMRDPKKLLAASYILSLHRGLFGIRYFPSRAYERSLLSAAVILRVLRLCLSDTACTRALAKTEGTSR